jgi:curved DNA-binding protein CbpA
MEDNQFVDFYELMQISPNAEPETIKRVYRLLAARYHPDNPESADYDRFVLLNQAHEILSDPASRAAYDLTYRAKREEPLNIFNLKEFAVGIDGESNRRMGILCLLYTRRRSNDEKPGMSLLEFESLMSFPREHLMFTVWYLQAKGLIERGEDSDYAITADGVDHVEQHMPNNTVLYLLLKAAETGSAHSTNGANGASETANYPGSYDHGAQAVA